MNNPLVPVQIYVSVIVVLIILTIFGKYKKRKWFLIVKPMTTICIIGLPLFYSSIPTIYQFLILLGLVTSLAGDIFLMFPEKYFEHGLFSFLLTHVLYTSAFVSSAEEISFLVAPIFPAYAIFIYTRLNLHDSRFKLPVLLYIIVICLMGYSAANLYIYSSVVNSEVLLGGAILFIISDSILAYNKFSGKFRYAEALILSTYFTGQLLIASTL